MNKFELLKDLVERTNTLLRTDYTIKQLNGDLILIETTNGHLGFSGVFIRDLSMLSAAFDWSFGVYPDPTSGQLHITI